MLRTCLVLAVLVAAPKVRAEIRVTPANCVLSGMHEGQQILVADHGPGDAVVDATRTAKYSVADPKVATVDAKGYVRPRGAGTTVVAVYFGGATQQVQVTVREAVDAPLHFENDILPLLTRHGCNSGGCHGRASGQNGFRLSLFAFDADFDHAAITKEARGRRLFAAAPEQSLFLTKATGQAPHGGGKPLMPESESYRTLVRWVKQGAPRGDERAPRLTKLVVSPEQRVLAPNASQQLAVTAHYTDGSQRDVTRQAQYDSNEVPVAAVDGDGLVRAFESPGEAAIMARYMGQVAVFRAQAPLPGKAPAFAFPASNFVDEHTAARWRRLGIVPSELCSDEEFLRRVTLDVVGRLPSLVETKAFLADRNPKKRDAAVDRLLADPDYASYSAMRWGAILRNSNRAGAEQASYAFHEWIRDLFARNRPYDELVRGVVAAAGEWQDAPAINWFWQMRDDQLHQPVADTAQVFLGLRIQCAKCHHHPYERWSQDDYYGLAGFFTRLGRKGGLSEPPPYYAARTTMIREIHPRTGKEIQPKALDGPVLTIAPADDPRHTLVDWMAQRENPFFARALVNRVWGHFLGRGIVEPVDDMRATNPPSNPELLDALASDFVGSKFDVKRLVRTIVTSRTYQLSSLPNERNKHDRQNFARFQARRLIAEVLHDAVDQVCGTRTQFPKMSKASRAIDLPHDEFGSYFLDVFDRPVRNSGCECARSNDANLSQVLHLTNSSAVEAKVTNGKGRVAEWLKAKTEPKEAIAEIYLVAFGRAPTAEESATVLAHFAREPDRKKAYEDVVWALINAKEFLFNR